MAWRSTQAEQHVGVITSQRGESYAVTSFVGPQQCQLVIWSKHRGVGHANLTWRQPSVMQLGDLYVDTAYRNQGLGKELIKLVVAAARSQGCTLIEGTVLLRDTRATPYLLAWLARQGFAIVPRPAHRAVVATITLVVPGLPHDDPNGKPPP
jgi:GNAT superfamily N-acetyltransferase